MKKQPSQEEAPVRKTGRPKKSQAPRLPYDQLDAVLVFGEQVTVGEGEGEGVTTYYPSYRELGRRYGVAHSLIADYSSKHDCMKRRALARARVVARTDEKLVELRANAIAMAKDDQIRVIDAFLHSFEKDLADGKVRSDDPAAFDRFCRLRAFLEGGADSRSEVHAGLSLEVIQERHRKMLKALEESSPAERGEVERRPRELAAAADRAEQEVGPQPPAPLSATVPQEVDVQPAVRGGDGGIRRAAAGPPNAASGHGR